MTIDYLCMASPGEATGGIGDPQEYPKVVAHFLDGHLVKGFALDFRHSRETFRIRLWDAVDPEVSTRIRLADLKALFFVKAFEGDATYRELSDTARASLLGNQVSVRFRDGEVLRGTSPRRDPSGAGFFLVPMDLRSNNRRVYVVVRNAARCRFEAGDKP
jgi:hypothetical protein